MFVIVISQFILFFLVSLSCQPFCYPKTAPRQSMNPITHLLLSWTIADEAGLQSKDRACVTWAGVVPDLDGLFTSPI